MNEEALKALEDIKAGLKTEIISDLEAKILDLKEATKSEGEKAEEARQKSLDYVKARYEFDVKGKTAQDLDTATTNHGEELVPEYFASEIVRVANKYGVVRQNSRNIPMPGKSLQFPTLGSLTAYRTDEKASFTASTPTTGQVTLTAKKLSAMAIVTRELIEDANIDTLSELAKLASEAIAGKEDEWGLKGLAGTEGIFRNATVPVYTLGSGDVTFAAVDFDDLADGLALVNDNLVDNMIWVGSFSLFNHLRTLRDTTTGMYIFQNPGGNMPRTIWDRPYFLSSVMPKTTQVSSQANTAFLAAYDPRYMFFGDRKQISIEFAKEATVTSASGGSDTINLFEQDMVAMKVTERIDIQLAQPADAFVRFETAAS